MNVIARLDPLSLPRWFVYSFALVGFNPSISFPKSSTSSTSSTPRESPPRPPPRHAPPPPRPPPKVYNFFTLSDVQSKPKQFFFSAKLPQLFSSSYTVLDALACKLGIGHAMTDEPKGNLVDRIQVCLRAYDKFGTISLSVVCVS